MTNDEYELMCSIDKAERDNENEKKKIDSTSIREEKVRLFLDESVRCDASVSSGVHNEFLKPESTAGRRDIVDFDRKKFN